MAEPRSILQRADEFRKVLDRARERLAGSGIAWYPYDAISNLWTVERLLNGQAPGLYEMAASGPVLDIGCADGDLSFFFESLGCEVDAIDYPVASFNAMRGVRALKQELQSGVQVIPLDLDSQFAVPRDEYRLALLLGVLYHLKNPFYVLETLAKHARYCLMSTAITAYVPGSYESVSGLPVALLPEIYEVNQDSTNYWLFTDAGFRRILNRSHWEVCRYLLLSEDGVPDRVGKIAGQRAFCLAKSRLFDSPAKVLYGKGWHAVEETGWRWTEQRFAVRIERRGSAAVSRLRLGVFVPEALIGKFPAISLHAAVNGIEAPSQRYDHTGEFEFSCDLARPGLGSGDLRVDFWLDQALAPDAGDPRERGIVISSCACL